MLILTVPGECCRRLLPPGTPSPMLKPVMCGVAVTNSGNLGTWLSSLSGIISLEEMARQAVGLHGFLAGQLLAQTVGKRRLQARGQELGALP